MNHRKSSVLTNHLSDLKQRVRQKGTDLAHLLLVLGLLLLALPPAVLAAPPAGSSAETPAAAEPDMARLAAMVRFYTDRHERAANAGSAQYRARATYLREVLFADQFGGVEDPARWAAVARFLRDRHERAANAGCRQYIALANSLGGVESARVEFSPTLGVSANEP